MINSHTIDMFITILISVLGSSGLWAYIQTKYQNKDTKTMMLLGLGHDRIVYLCSKYLEKGFITYEEYENLYEYLYKPYKALGGNGTAERLMDEVKKLPVTSPK